MSDRQAEDTRRALASFFRVEQHNFPDTEQNQWLDFAVRASVDCSNILDVCTAGKAEVSLLEILELLARERNRFAATQPDLSGGRVEDFGRWRDGVYDQSVDSGRQVELRRAALNAALQRAGYPLVRNELDIRASLTMYEKEHTLYQSVVENLAHCEKNDPAAIGIAQEVDATSHKVLSQFIQSKLTISPATFFDVARYRRYQLFDDATRATSFTNFYVLSHPQPTFFVIMEHPTPRKVSEMMFTEISERFTALLSAKDQPGYLTALADFNWYCHQLMPFERGSASIFLILTASLLCLGNVPLTPYPGNRLDIDAISLTRDLFRKKFTDTFARR